MSAAPEPPTPPTPGRSCAGCTMCCKLLGIQALDKPPGTWCAHCAVGEGCTIYASRPKECRDFNCAYVIDAALSEEWAPKRSKIVVSVDPNSIVIFVDPSRPGAWRKPPFFAAIKTWAAAAAPVGKQVLVFEGAQITAMLPDREKPLGERVPGQVFVLTRAQRPEGPVYDVLMVDPDDPRAKRVIAG